MHSVPSPDMESKEGELQNFMGNLVQFTSANAPMLRTFENMRISAFRVRCGSRSTPIAGQFDIMCNCMTHIFQYGIQPYSADGAACLARLQPVLSELEKPPLPFVRTSCRTAMCMQKNTCRRPWKISLTRTSRSLRRICRSGWCSRSTR